MNRYKRILGGCAVAALLLLLPSCATVPGRYISVEQARQSLQNQYPDLLRTFDLHLGVFQVDESAWDSLTPERRTDFLNQCVRARSAVTGGTHIVVRTEGDMLATFDGSNAVFYGTALITGAGTAIGIAPASATGTEDSPSIPTLVSLPHPVYPVEALKAHVEGTVVLRARVAPDGRVRDVELVDGGISVLNPAAIEAVRNARFQPFYASVGSDSIWVRIPMHFAIAGMPGMACPRPDSGPAPVTSAQLAPIAERPSTTGAAK